jgi:DNA-directed RNA polymerase specialized sigma24 family protein
VQRLPERPRQAIEAYFLHFLTEPAAAEALGGSVEELLEWLRQGLLTLLIHDRLAYCLLRQIERY